MNERVPALRFGPGDARWRVLLIPPLFDEANRMRRTLAMTMRALADQGVASLLPDLPAQGESLLPNEAATLELWREGLRELARNERPLIVASWRGGALIDDAVEGALGWWRMSPVAGASLVRALLRTRIAGDKEGGRTTTADSLRRDAAAAPVELGGYRLSGAMLDQLDRATPVAVSPVREVTPAEMNGSALWLRSQPGEDRAMAEAMAADLANWGKELATLAALATPPTSAPEPKPPSPQREIVWFDVDGSRCAATLDRAAGSTGLLIVSGGNEVRCGAHRGMAELAGTVAAEGWPVFRYDRRGIGDSEGENREYLSAEPDIAAAARTFREACPQVTRLVAFGNCDSATALALFANAAGIDRLLLGNPWTLEDEGDGAPGDEAATPLPSPAEVRARYLAKLTQPSEWWRLLRGGVDLGKLAKGIARARQPDAPPAAVAERLLAALANGGDVRILLASRDRIAREFERTIRLPGLRIERVDSASHSFADDAARDWLRARILAALRED